MASTTKKEGAAVSGLDSVDSIHVATVLEDCVDQLCVLGKIMPATFDLRPDASSIVDAEINLLIQGQLELEGRYQTILLKKLEVMRNTRNAAVLAEIEREVLEAGADLKNTTHVFGRGLRQNPLTTDNIQKIQEDRLYLENIVTKTMLELINNCSFNNLSAAVDLEKVRKAKLQETIQKEENGRKKIKQLQKHLQEVKKEKEEESQQRNEMIAHLKDQVQELKAKSNMEEKYINKSAQVAIAQTQKRCILAETDMREEIERLIRGIDDESRANGEIENYLRKHIAELEKLVDYWTEKYEKDVEAKQHELDVLKACKAKDLERLQELTRLYRDYEQVVIEDRILKEKARRKVEAEGIELKAAIKIQAWWRGTMVRKGFGPFSKKKKKGKKGKKGKKKK